MRALVIIFILALIPPLAASEVREFTAEYEIYYGNLHLGKGNYRFTHSEGNHYRFEFVSKMRFLIFTDVRHVMTEVMHEDPYLRPAYYSHDRKGSGPDYFEDIDFNRADKLITSSYKKEIKEFAYENDIIDGLTVQLQMILDLRRGIERPKYKILDSNRIREREFTYIREELIHVEGVDYNSVLYQLVRDDKRKRTQVWYSPEHGYLPVKMEHYSKGKKKFNARLIAVDISESHGSAAQAAE